MDKPIALVIGDYTAPPYHPLKGIDTAISSLLSEYFNVKCTEDRDALVYENLKNCDLCISYVDAWEKQLLSEQIQGLCRYVSDGGGLLAIHNGISYQSTPEFAELIGARFTTHPPYQKLTYSVTGFKHPITEGIGDFQIDEELYLYEIINQESLSFLMECSNGDTTSPAAWVKSYGKGRVAYIAPGHDINTFQNKVFQKLILQGALWAGKVE